MTVPGHLSRTSGLHTVFSTFDRGPDPITARSASLIVVRTPNLEAFAGEERARSRKAGDPYPGADLRPCPVAIPACGNATRTLNC
jgi:hypothetical protein